MPCIGWLVGFWSLGVRRFLFPTWKGFQVVNTDGNLETEGLSCPAIVLVED